MQTDAMISAESEPAYTERPVTFRNGEHTVAGALAVPAGSGPHPAVVLVHGAGPADRTYNGFFAPIREGLLRHRIAVLWYDKPGVPFADQPDGPISEGDWRDQSFDDRTNEVLAAVELLHSYDEIEARSIGVLGYSQGWWAVAQAAAQSPAIAFAVCLGGSSVSPAEQEIYRVEHELRGQGAGEEQVAQAVALFKQGVAAALNDAPFAQVEPVFRPFRDEPWFPLLYFPDDERLWSFLKGVVRHEPQGALEHLRCPLLIVYGESDTRLPIHKSATRFQEQLAHAGNHDVTVRFFPRNDHFMFDVETRQPDLSFIDAIGQWIRERTGQAARRGEA